MSKVIFLISTIFVLTSCKKHKESRDTSSTDNSVKTPYTSSNHPGKKLMETKCYVCHSPKTDHDSRIAPPMVSIKSHYLNDNTTIEQFEDAIWSFVKQPSIEKSKMKGAVRRFRVMPYQSFSEEEIKLISDYIYNFKIDEPGWFKEHTEEEEEEEEESNGEMKYRNEGQHNDKNDNYTSDAFAKTELKTQIETGIKYALNTKKELGKYLMGTLRKKGILAAVTFCNKQAYPITDSMAIAQNAIIKRISDKPRNPKNSANRDELKIVEKFKKAIANNEDYTPVTLVVDSKVHFYAPITTNSMCLKCHGTPEKDIKPNVLKTIANLYPKDLATGYAINEVRGIWSITYDK